MPAYLRKATWVTSSGPMKTASPARPMTSAANVIIMAETPTAAPSGSWIRISSHSATENLAPRSSALISDAIIASASQPMTTRTVITMNAIHQWPGPLMISVPAMGRNAKATQGTATSRVASPVRPAGPADALGAGEGPEREAGTRDRDERGDHPGQPARAAGRHVRQGADGHADRGDGDHLERGDVGHRLAAGPPPGPPEAR